MIGIIIETYVIKFLHFAKLCIESVRFQAKKLKFINFKENFKLNLPFLFC